MEKVMVTILYQGVVFEVIGKQETFFAGKAYYADTSPGCDLAVFADAEDTKEALVKVVDPILPEKEINISLNFWKDDGSRQGVVFAKETKTKNQPDGVDVLTMPASLFIRAYTDINTAKLLNKSTCEIWELFAFIRENIMPENGYRMAENGAQEIEYYDSAQRSSGYAYVPVEKIK